MTDRDDVIARIKALRARAANAASSEAEAEAAARIAAKIIAEHEITEAELIERGAKGVSEGEHNRGRAVLHPALDAASYSIGQLSECHAAFRGGANVWIGQPEDVAFALYLCELIQGASERAYKAHWSRHFGYAPSAKFRKSFLLGFGLGVAARMDRMAGERQRQRQEEAGTGTNLVVVKDAIISEYMDATYPDIRERRARKRKPDLFALLHGQRAAEKVVLNRPLETDDVDKSAQVTGHG